MSERIRVGIVGASPQSWAAAAHLPALAHLDELTVTAVATTRQDSARAAADMFGIRHAFASAEELASHPEVDLVVASVKVPAHAAVIRAALAAGKHVYAEWPLGVDLAEASALADAAAAARVVHAVGLQAYHSPGPRFVADLLADGRIGAVEAVSMTAAGDPLGGSRIPRSLAWSTEPAAGNNLLTVMAGHALGALERVTGPLADVSAVLANLHAPGHGGRDRRTDRQPRARPGRAARPAGQRRTAVAEHPRRQRGRAERVRHHDHGHRRHADHHAGRPGALPGLGRMACPAQEHRRRGIGPAGPRPLPAHPGRGARRPARAHSRPVPRDRAGHRRRPAGLPGFDTAVHHHRTLAAIERAAQTGVRQSLAPRAGGRAA